MDLTTFSIFVICFLGAYVSTVTAMGGGLLILAAVSQLLPATEAIPLNSAFVLSSLFSRSVHFRREIDWSITKPFVLGALSGALLGSLVFSELSEDFVGVLLGLVMLWMCWAPRAVFKPTIPRARTPFFLAVGLLHSFLSTLTGAGGLFQAIVTQSTLTKKAVVGTLASSVFFLSIFKMAAYALNGFSYEKYAVPILLGWLGGIAGTSVGSKTLDRFSEKTFHRATQVVITLFAVRLFAQVLTG